MQKWCQRAKPAKIARMEKQRPPVTSCTNCGKVGYNITIANERCGQTIDRKRCKGTIQSAIGENDWAECHPVKVKDGKMTRSVNGATVLAGCSFVTALGC
jgi:hypothetical protein